MIKQKQIQELLNTLNLEVLESKIDKEEYIKFLLELQFYIPSFIKIQDTRKMEVQNG
jgi:hypothetical protein